MNIPITSLTVLAVLTSLNGVQRSGTTIQTNAVDPLSCVFLCTSAVTTSLVVATFKLQGTFDGTNYFDITGATWSSAAGTGSAVTTRQSLSVPNGVHGFKGIRCVATLSGASTVGADTTLVVVNYNPMGNLFARAIPT